jgi:pimeloyl-ACP methyl ester carboxylesterase
MHRQKNWTRNSVNTDRYIKNLSRPGALTAALNWYRAAGARYLTVIRMRTSGERIKGPFRYEKIAGASHWLMLDKPAELNRLLVGFLKK